MCEQPTDVRYAGVRIVSPMVGAGVYATLGGGALTLIGSGTFVVATLVVASLFLAGAVFIGAVTD